MVIWCIVNRDGIDGHELFERLSQGEIKSGGFDLNGLWSPWYTLHKTYAGLRDAFRYTGNKTALKLEVRFAEWAERILKPLNENQIQRMLNTEFGGMNEVMVDLYADTGNKRWLDLSYKFEHRSFMEPLKRHQDILDGKDGNTDFELLLALPTAMSTLAIQRISSQPAFFGTGSFNFTVMPPEGTVMMNILERPAN